MPRSKRFHKANNPYKLKNLSFTTATTDFMRRRKDINWSEVCEDAIAPLIKELRDQEDNR